MSQDSRTDKPAIRVIPPAIAGLFLAAGIVLGWFLPLQPFAFWTGFFIGLLLALTGVVLVIWAIDTFVEKETSVRIDRPATSLITSGPYSFSRNPIYLGGALGYVGIALIFNSGWALLFMIPLLSIIINKVIVPEETYLENKFGETYLTYKARVKRWL